MYAKEEGHGNTEGMIERALSAFGIFDRAAVKTSAFKEHPGREANALLRNLTKNRHCKI